MEETDLEGVTPVTGMVLLDDVNLGAAGPERLGVAGPERLGIAGPEMPGLVEMFLESSRKW